MPEFLKLQQRVREMRTEAEALRRARDLGLIDPDKHRHAVRRLDGELVKMRKGQVQAQQ